MLPAQKLLASLLSLSQSAWRCLERDRGMFSSRHRRQSFLWSLIQTKGLLFMCLVTAVSGEGYATHTTGLYFKRGETTLSQPAGPPMQAVGQQCMGHWHNNTHPSASDMSSPPLPPEFALHFQNPTATPDHPDFDKHPESPRSHTLYVSSHRPPLAGVRRPAGNATQCPIRG